MSLIVKAASTLYAQQNNTTNPFGTQQLTIGSSAASPAVVASENYASGGGLDKADSLFTGQFVLAPNSAMYLDMYTMSNTGGAAPLDADGSSYAIVYAKHIEVILLGDANAYALTAVGSIAAGGNSYQVGDVLVIAPGTGGQTNSNATCTVTTVSTGAVTGVSILTPGSYTVQPATSSPPNATTAGSPCHGTGCTLNCTFTNTVTPSTAFFTEGDVLRVGGQYSSDTTGAWTSPFDKSGGNVYDSAILLRSGSIANPGRACLCGGGLGYTVGASSTNHKLNLSTPNTNALPLYFNVYVVGATS